MPTKRMTASVNPFARLNDSLADSNHALIDRLGEGGMGDVFLARDARLRRNVALKQLRSDDRDSDAEQRFLREACITAELDHPGVVPVYALVDGLDGKPAYTMRVVDGQTLAEVMAEAVTRAEAKRALTGRYALTRRLELFLRACETIAFAHAHGVIHRDIKPANIMIGPHEEVYVVDWGLAKKLDERGTLVSGSDDGGGALADHDATDVTLAGPIGGTPRYLAPERHPGSTEPVDARCDQYALGVILFELVFLRPAFEQLELDELFRASAAGRTAPAQSLGGGESIQPALVAIIHKAMAVEPAARYASVTDLTEDLRRYLRDEPIEAAPDNLFHAAARGVSKHRQVVLVLLLLAGFGAVAANSWWLYHEQRNALAASERSRQIGQRVMSAVDQSRELDLTLQRIEGRLGRLAEVARLVMASPGRSSAAYYLNRRFDPPDLTASIFYGDRISPSWPVFKLAPGVEEEAVRGRLRQLAQVRPVLRDLVLVSGTIADDADAKRQLVVGGLDIVSAFIGTEEGIMALFPGRGGYAASYDPRTRPWYRAGAEGTGPRWSPPYTSSQNVQATLVACSLAIREESGRLVGVAGVDLRLATLGRELNRRLRAADWADRALLLDPEARVVLAVDRAPGAAAGPEEAKLTLPAYWNDEVAAAVRQKRRFSYFETARDERPRFLAVSQLSSTGWTLVLEGAPP